MPPDHRLTNQIVTLFNDFTNKAASVLAFTWLLGIDLYALDSNPAFGWPFIIAQLLIYFSWRYYYNSWRSIGEHKADSVTPKKQIFDKEFASFDMTMKKWEENARKRAEDD